MRVFMDLHQTIRVYFHSHGEESQNHIQLMVLLTQSSNGSINQLLRKHLLLRSLILVTRKSMKVFMELPVKTPTWCQHHTQEKSMLAMEYWTQHSNTCSKSKSKISETPSGSDPMSTISSMRISDRFQLTEEKLHQNTLSRPDNQVQELILYQVVQAVPSQMLSQQPRQQNQPRALLRCTEMEKVRVRLKAQPQSKLQRRLWSYSHWSISIELTLIPQTWEPLSMLNKDCDNWQNKEIRNKFLLKSSDICI